MIITITQTYGDDRRELYDIRSKDNLLKYFISSFDHDIFSFHNSSSSTIDYFKNTNKSSELVEFGNIPYTSTLKLIIEKLKKLKCKKVIFLQDDVFSQNQDLEELNYIIQEIKNDNIPLLNMEVKKDDFKLDIQNKMEFIKKNNDTEIWKSFTSHFAENGNYAFDDGPYVLDFDFINTIYDLNFFNFGDVWQSENYNNLKFKNLDFPRYITNKRFFKRYNILGRNNWNRDVEIEELKKLFLK
jgi:hypothetical protein